ncbi:hypothetical protein [Metabacillus malikii]|uniref:Uncharacterized protein n=1 Tax=Metabacillus malikii TaxID=1504265 RepID=A0ABT9ZKU5_9BACI|nr:hypothetical protein [Metabacillus malikii]MDQ0232605.1 hypothetical protein [Metabacillus malikii]
MTNQKNLLALFLVFSILSGCVADGGKISAKDVLKQNSNADILQYDGFIYSNISELEWFKEEKERYIKHNLLGEIKKQSTSSLRFKDLTATKLPIGAKLYSTSENEKDLGILIVEDEEIDLYYMKLLEG